MEEVKAIPKFSPMTINYLKPITIDNCKNPKLSKCKIFWCFISFIISVADVTVIIILSYLHFVNEAAIVAWIMLLPILLNFIGIFTFLSNKKERREMEELGGKRFKNWMFFPVIGPSVSALRLCVYAFQESSVEKFERLESLLTRMKQYETFFRAAPEAFIQIAARIFNYSELFKFHMEDHWTSACIALSVFSLAESHMYAPINKYYRMFSYNPTENLWRTGNIQRKWRLLLFIFTFFSINSRLIADSLQKATTCFFFTNFSFGEVIVFNFLCQFILRAAIYGLYNSWMGSPKRKIQVEDEGVYGAFTYSWRCLFLSFDFLSYYKPVFFWFYIENILMISIPYLLIYVTPWFTSADDNNILQGKIIFHVYAILAITQMIFAILIKLGVRYHWKKNQSDRSNIMVNK